LLSALSANDNVSVDNIRRSSLRQHQPYGSRGWPVQWDHVRAGLANQPGKPRLPGRVPHDLRQCRCRYRYTKAPFHGSCQQRQNLAITAIDGDQPTASRVSPLTLP